MWEPKYLGKEVGPLWAVNFGPAARDSRMPEVLLCGGGGLWTLRGVAH